MFAVLVLVQVDFQLNDLVIIQLLPFSYEILKIYHVHVRMHWGDNRYLGGQLGGGPQAPSKITN